MARHPTICRRTTVCRRWTVSIFRSYCAETFSSQTRRTQRVFRSRTWWQVLFEGCCAATSTTATPWPKLLARPCLRTNVGSCPFFSRASLLQVTQLARMSRQSSEPSSGNARHCSSGGLVTPNRSQGELERQLPADRCLPRVNPPLTPPRADPKVHGFPPASLHPGDAPCKPPARTSTSPP